jgi:hypothetical protein
MILSISSLRVKKPLYFFFVSYYAFWVTLQIHFKSKCKKIKTIGVGLETYTMTLWENEQDIKDFYLSGAHKRAMEKAVKYAKEIKVYKMPSNDLVSWTEAKSLLANQKSVI